MDEGWIKLHRVMQDSPIMRNGKTLQVWLWLLFRAGWIGKKKGAVETKYRIMEDALGLTTRELRTALAALALDDSITLEATRRGMVIVIKKWDFYQMDEKKRQADDRQTTGTMGFSDTELHIPAPKNIRIKERTIAATNPAAKDFTDWFFARYQQAHGLKPMPPVWAWKKCANVVATLGLDEMKRRAENYFTDPLLKTHPLEGLISSPDKWAARRGFGFPDKTTERVQLDRKRTAL